VKGTFFPPPRPPPMVSCDYLLCASAHVLSVPIDSLVVSAGVESFSLSPLPVEYDRFRVTFTMPDEKVFHSLPGEIFEIGIFLELRSFSDSTRTPFRSKLFFSFSDSNSRRGYMNHEGLYSRSFLPP